MLARASSVWASGSKRLFRVLNLQLDATNRLETVNRGGGVWACSFVFLDGGRNPQREGEVKRNFFFQL